jgi:hypothetical protein
VGVYVEQVLPADEEEFRAKALIAPVGIAFSRASGRGREGRQHRGNEERNQAKLECLHDHDHFCAMLVTDQIELRLLNETVRHFEKCWIRICGRDVPLLVDRRTRP